MCIHEYTYHLEMYMNMSRRDAPRMHLNQICETGVCEEKKITYTSRGEHASRVCVCLCVNLYAYIYVYVYVCVCVCVCVYAYV